MQRWKINLVVLMCGNFLVMAGFTMVMPFLALYLKQNLGMTNDHEIGVWAGFIFAANFVTSIVLQPLWGKLSDRYGRKMMLLRSGFGMAVVVALMGFVTAPWQLLVLRMMNGAVGGFIPAATSLVSATAPKERIGFAMGTLQSGGTAGAVLGPFFGGLLADSVGFRPIFYITGGLLFLASAISWILIHENFDRQAARQTQSSVLGGFRELMAIRQLPVLLSISLLIQFAMLSPMPLIPLYVEDLHGTTANLAFFAGFVGSVTGFSNMICAPLLGKLGDRVGAMTVLFISLAGAAATIIPQAFVGSVGELLVWRFMHGCFIGGLIPTVNALTRRFTPDGMESRSFSFNTSALGIGNMLGPIAGGALSGFFGIEGIFIMSGALLLATCFWALYALPGRRRQTA